MLRTTTFWCWIVSDSNRSRLFRQLFVQPDFGVKPDSFDRTIGATKNPRGFAIRAAREKFQLHHLEGSRIPMAQTYKRLIEREDRIFVAKEAVFGFEQRNAGEFAAPLL